MKEKRDITSAADIEGVVKDQYELLLLNPQTAPHFTPLDLSVHLPKIITFWCFVLDVEAETHSYRGSVIEQHLHLHLTDADFVVWQTALHSALVRFEGPKKKAMLEKAKQMEYFLRLKMHRIP